MLPTGDRPGARPDGPLRPFPPLPIVTAPAPGKRTESQKYGSLYYAGIAGLLVVVGLVGWFGWGLWSLRDLWRDIYILHDSGRTDIDRVNAALRLSRDGRLSRQQGRDIALSKPLPDLARYLVAESLTDELVADDPRSYTLAVARSEGWPDWLRLLMLRPAAYASPEVTLPGEALDELSRHPDGAVRLWALYAKAVAKGHPDSGALRTLENEGAGAGPFRELAGLLGEAVAARPSGRGARLDRATLWLRTHHPAAARIWKGWRERGGRLERESAPELR